MSGLNDKLLEIKRQKDTYILPENIRKNVTVYGITGTLEAGSGEEDVKLFETVEEMQQDTTAQKGDLALVYKKEVQSITDESEFDSCIFPNEVVLNEAYSGNLFGGFRAVNEEDNYDGMIDLSSSNFYFEGRGQKEIRIQYTSQDGITYTRTDGGDELQKFDTLIKWASYGEEWNDVIGNFMKIIKNHFNGVFEYTDNTIKSNKILIPHIMGSSSSSVEFNLNDYIDVNIYELREQMSEFMDMEDLRTDLGDASNGIFEFVRDNQNKIIGIKAWGCDALFQNGDKWAIGYFTSSSPSTVKFAYAYIDLVNKVVTNQSKVDLVKTDIKYGTSGNVWITDEFKDFNFLYQYFFKDNMFGYGSLSNIIDNTNVYIGSGVEIKYGNAYVLSKTDINVEKEYVYNKTFFGLNGIEEGIVGLDLSDKFRDVNAEIYGQLQVKYDEMPIIICDDNTKFIQNSNIACVPSKSTGEPLLDTSNLTNMYSFFYMCRNLLVIPCLEMGNVTNAGFMFSECKKLKSIPLLDLHSLSNADDMFQVCSSLVTLPQFNLSNVTTCRSMFSSCTSLENVPIFNLSKVTNMESIFNNCPKLSDNSLNNIMQMCINAVSYTGTKTLKYIGLSQTQATTCQSLSNWSAFTNAGWTTGY